MYPPTNYHFFSFFSFGPQLPAIQQNSKYRAKAQAEAETTPLTPVRTPRHAWQHTAGQNDRRIPDFLLRYGADVPRKALRPDRPQESRNAEAPRSVSSKFLIHPARRIGTRHGQDSMAALRGSTASRTAPGAATAASFSDSDARHSINRAIFALYAQISYFCTP